MLIPRSSDISVDSARDRSARGSIEMARTRSIADIHEIKQDLHEPSCCATRLKTCKQRTVKMLREQAAPYGGQAQPWRKKSGFLGSLLRVFVSWLKRSRARDAHAAAAVPMRLFKCRDLVQTPMLLY